MADIYRSVYAGKHYYIGIAESNLADVYVEKKNYKEGERLFREALSMYAQTLPPEHQLVGIARVRLGARDSPATPLFGSRKRKPRRI